jgi:hypothetical protein
MFDELHDPSPRRSTPADVATSLRRGDRIRRRRQTAGGAGAIVLVAAVALGVSALTGRGHTKVRISATAGPTGSTSGDGRVPAATAPPTTSLLAIPITPVPTLRLPVSAAPGSSPPAPPVATATTTIVARTTSTMATPPVANPATVNLTRADNGRTISVAKGTTIDITLGPDPTSPEGAPNSIDTSVVTPVSETHGTDGSSSTVLRAVGMGHTQILGPWGGVPCDAGKPCPAIEVAHFGVTVDVV